MPGIAVDNKELIEVQNLSYGNTFSFLDNCGYTRKFVFLEHPPKSGTVRAIKLYDDGVTEVTTMSSETKVKKLSEKILIEFS